MVCKAADVVHVVHIMSIKRKVTVITELYISIKRLVKFLLTSIVTYHTFLIPITMMKISLI